MIGGRGIEGVYRNNKSGGSMCMCLCVFVCIVSLSVCMHVYFSVFLCMRVFLCVHLCAFRSQSPTLGVILCHSPLKFLLSQGFSQA